MNTYKAAVTQNDGVATQKRLNQKLAYLRDFGYQPMYNGRPSCPFCVNFVDDEEAHQPSCVLLALVLE